MATWTTPTAVHSKCGEDGSYPATNTKDDDTGTYWRHSATCLHWIILDLGQTYAVSKIRLYQTVTAGQRWGKTDGLDVYVSDDPADFGSAVWTGALNAEGWQESGAFSKNGRYVKLVSKADSQYQRMYEFGAYCEAVVTVKPRSFGCIIGWPLKKLYEDFTSFTEVDIAADRIQKTAHHIDHYAKNNETTYLYKDYGAAHFGDFTHRIKVKNVAGGTGKGVVWMLCDELGDVHSLQDTEQTFINIWLYGSDRMYLEEGYSGLTHQNWYGISADTWYYVKIVKSGTSLNAYIYSDAGYSTLLDTLTLTLHGNWNFRYLYGCNTHNSGFDHYEQTDIENFDLGE